jgi:hypothetical protein
MKNSLNLLEKSVLEKILQGESIPLLKLRHQIDNCIVKERDFTGYGFFTKLAVPENIQKIDDLNLKFGDVFGSVPGVEHGVGFLVYIKDGIIYMLEGYSYDEPWPEIINDFDLKYTDGDVRDWINFPSILR